MDDTAFHYSRTLRIIMILAIVVPLVGIAALLWYFGSVDVPAEQPPASAFTDTAPGSTQHELQLDEEELDGEVGA